MSDLLPCPSCGSAENLRLIRHIAAWPSGVICRCGMTATSVERWNTRALPAAPDGTEKLGIAGRDWRSGEHQKWEKTRAIPAARADAAAIREAALVAALKECAEGLAAYVNAEFPISLRDEYPLYEVQYARNMGPVTKAFALIDNPGKEVMPSEARSSRAAHDTAPAGLSAGGGDWPEDAAHENGNYLCECVQCGNQFFGHKRRVTCKTCAGGGAEARSKTIREFCDKAGIKPSQEVLGLPLDVRLWRMETAVAARRATDGGA